MTTKLSVYNDALSALTYAAVLATLTLALAAERVYADMAK